LGPGDIGIFPLAFPVIAGPAGLTAVVLLMGQAHGDPLGSMIVLGAMLLCLLLTYISMIFTDVLHSLLKATGSNVLARLAGVILAALAVQFVFDGIRGARLVAAADSSYREANEVTKTINVAENWNWMCSVRDLDRRPRLASTLAVGEAEA
jgi:hypothetical protein